MLGPILSYMVVTIFFFLKCGISSKNEVTNIVKENSPSSR